jgi:hypothetical protein
LLKNTVDYKVAIEPITLVHASKGIGNFAEDVVWKSPLFGTYKANWDVAIDNNNKNKKKKKEKKRRRRR